MKIYKSLPENVRKAADEYRKDRAEFYSYKDTTCDIVFDVYKAKETQMYLSHQELCFALFTHYGTGDGPRAKLTQLEQEIKAKQTETVDDLRNGSKIIKTWGC